MKNRKESVGHEKGKTEIFDGTTAFFGETVKQIVLAVNFTNRRMGDELSKFVACSEDASALESHKKQFVKKTKWVIESGGGIPEEIMGIHLRQMTIHGREALDEILNWAKRNGMENVRLRLKLRKVSENSFKRRGPLDWTFKYKLKIYFLKEEDAKFPKKGTTVVPIDKVRHLSSALDELLNAAFLAHIYFNRLPIPSFAIECVMRNPQAKSWRSLLLS